MKIESILIILVLIGVLLLSGCIGKTEQTDVDKTTLACVNECKSWLNAGKDLSNGPCLLNPIPELPDWVCDVAHSPRLTDIDNLPDNQCSEYGRTAKHFVEVDPRCELIRTV